jgi:uncharacterized protein YggE
MKMLQTRSTLHLMAIALLLTPCAALAQAPQPPRITVIGKGSVRTPPDRAQISFTVRGEGNTADEAVTKLNTSQKAIETALTALGKGRFVFSTERFAVAEVRDQACNNITYQPRLSVGACAIIGYVATLPATLRADDIDNAGTAVGLIGRLDGSDARMNGYSLSDPKAAQRQAMTAALDDARTQAEAIATGAKVKLGTILSIQDGAANNEFDVPLRESAKIVVTSAPAPPPIRVDLKPEPIETRASVTVVYAIER